MYTHAFYTTLSVFVFLTRVEAKYVYVECRILVFQKERKLLQYDFSQWTTNPAVS